MKNLIIFIAIVTLLIACTKNSNREVTVTGRLMQTCETPAANRNGIIHLSGGGLLNHPSTSLEFTTDENGYFKVTHNKSFSEFSVRTSANHSVLEANISGDEKELGEVYINPFPTNFIIKLDVKNPYTENDTLVMKDFSSSNPLAQRKIAGPFESGVLEIIESHPFNMFPLHFSQTINGNTPKYGVRFHMIPFTGDIERFDFNIAPICSGEFAEVTLVID